MQDEIDRSLRELASACADNLAASKFVELWQLADGRRIEELEINVSAGLSPEDALAEKRFHQLRALHDRNALGSLIRSLIDRAIAVEIKRAISRYVTLTTIDLSGLDSDETLDAAQKQALLTARDAYMNQDDILNFSVHAFPRICCIVGLARKVRGGLIETKPIGGTGFLVGPDLVLTNCHVVQDFFHEPDQAIPPSARDGTYEGFACFFDHSTASVIDDHSREHAGTVRIKPDRNWLVACSLPTQTVTDRANCLDFALVKLSSPIGNAAVNRVDGRRRGWFKVPTVGSFPAIINDTRVASPQHPAGFGHKLDIGRVRGAFDEKPQRIAYDMNTGDGSSGSPVLVTGGVLAALHEAGPERGVPKPPPPDCYNRGVLISSFAHLIHEHTAANGELPPLDALWTVRTEHRADHPLIGRDDMLNWVDACRADNAPPVRLILGAPRTGKSFSVDILRAKLMKTNDIVLVFTAGKDRSQAFELTDDPRMILAEVARALSLRDIETIPPPPPEAVFETTSVGPGIVIDMKPNPWASSDLTNWLLARLQPEHAAARIWIVVDVPSGFSFGTRMQDFMSTWTNLAGPGHPFRIFRWLFIGADPTGKVPPQSQDILDPKAQITTDSLRSFVRSAYQAVGYPNLTKDVATVWVPFAFEQIDKQSTDHWSSVVAAASSLLSFIQTLKADAP